jgi:hypothetical protein
MPCCPTPSPHREPHSCQYRAHPAQCHVLMVKALDKSDMTAASMQTQFSMPIAPSMHAKCTATLNRTVATLPVSLYLERARVLGGDNKTHLVHHVTEALHLFCCPEALQQPYKHRHKHGRLCTWHLPETFTFQARHTAFAKREEQTKGPIINSLTLHNFKLLQAEDRGC